MQVAARTTGSGLLGQTDNCCKPGIFLAPKTANTILEPDELTELRESSVEMSSVLVRSKMSKQIMSTLDLSFGRHCKLEFLIT